MKDQPDLSALSREELKRRETQLAVAGARAVRATKFARFQPLEYQREWFAAKEPIGLFTLPNQTGKCVHPDAPVTLGSGDFATARDLVGTEFEIATIDGPRRARAEWNRIEPTWSLTTRRGISIERNAQHPVWSAEVVRTNRAPRVRNAGWRHVADITPGMVVAVATEVEFASSRDVSDEHVELLAMLIGDGYLAAETPSFTQAPGPLLARFKECVAAIGLRATEHSAAGHVPFYRVVGEGAREATTGRFVGGSNSLTTWLRDLGLYGGKSGDHFIPNVIWRAPRDQQALFLNRLFSCDGWACESGANIQVGFASKSRKLIDGVRDLLLRFGIRSRVRRKRVRAMGDDYEAHSLDIAEGNSIIAFADRIGIIGKEQAVERVRELAAARVAGRKPRWYEIDAPPLCFWDEVVSVERAAAARTVAIEVPEGRTFVSPLYEHNTTFGSIRMIAACLGVMPTALGGVIPERWPSGSMAGKKFLVAGATYDKITNETIWPTLQKYISDDMILSVKRGHGGFISTVTFVTGAVLAFRSYDQHWKKFEGGNFDGAWFDEPPPREVWQAVRRGQMATEGWAIITGTPLPGDSWMRDDLIHASVDLDCAECSGGETPHAEIVERMPLHGRVFIPSPIEMEQNCRDHHGGFLPHAEIVAFLSSIQDDALRLARQHGMFVDANSLTFGYVNDADNVVEDFDPPLDWPLVEIVDPSPKRGLHIKWYTCDENDRWYNTHAERIPSDGGFRRMSAQIFAHRARLGRQPDLCLMDPRGGHHKQVGSDGIKDWFDQFKAHGITYIPAVAPSVENARVQVLHDWLKPIYDPSKGTTAVPKLRFCRRMRVMKKGPLWAYERFQWDPVMSPKKQYEQECKDFIDCDTYLALWVEKHRLTFRKWQAQDNPPPPKPGIAASYAGAPGQSRAPARRDQWGRRPGLGASYRTTPEWVRRINPAR